MQRPIIFVATADPTFEAVAQDAILSTHHGMRRARDLDTAGAMLAAGTSDVALAIIDLDLRKGGLPLLSILGSCEPDHPILAIANDIATARAEEWISGVALDCLPRSVDAGTLREKIRHLCNIEARPALEV